MNSGTIAGYRHTLAAVALAALAGALFAPAIGFRFIAFDDDQYVYGNPVVQRGLTLETVNSALGDVVSAHWHPLTMLSYLVDAEIFGMKAWGFHLVNVLLHALNSALVFLVLRGMTGAFGPSAFVAALFAVHPLHVEPVAWISSRKDVLSTAFWLLCLGAYTRYARTLSPGWYLTMIACFVLGLLSKSILITVPFLMLVLDYWPLRRFAPDDLLTRDGRRKIAGLLAEKLPLVPLVALFLWANAVAQRGSGNMNTGGIPFPRRLANAAAAYANYLLDFVWPAGLGAYYPLPQGGHPPGVIVLSTAVLVVISVIALLSWRRRPFLLTGWLWFLGTLVPVIGLVQLGSQARADRYMYVPFIGLGIMAAWTAADAFTRRPKFRAAAAVTGIGACVVVTSAQLQHWRDSETIFRHTLAVTKGNYHIHYNLGRELERQGRVDEAVAEYEKALAVLPDHPHSNNNLGSIYARRGDFAAAAARYEAALRGRPDDPVILCNLAMAYADLGDLDRAREAAAQAQRIAPDLSITRMAVRAVENLANKDAGLPVID